MPAALNCMSYEILSYRKPEKTTQNQSWRQAIPYLGQYNTISQQTVSLTFITLGNNEIASQVKEPNPEWISRAEHEYHIENSCLALVKEIFRI